MGNLSTKYRPQTFADCCGQNSVVKILEQQCKTKQIKNAYIFSGPSGTGKTTIARILANRINEGAGEPIEIDAASNNGVDNIRQVIDGATERALDAEYKVYILDEAHQITSAGWASMLKTIEETPKYTIFMFCTTEYQKIPATIKNRCQQYFLSRVPEAEIKDRLRFICNQESIKFTDEGLTHIAKLAQGSVRLAISYLEKCRDYSETVDISNVLATLGDFSYDIYFELVNSIIDKDKSKIIKTFDNMYQKGNNLAQFLDLFIDFVLDLDKYIIFRSFDIIKIPVSYKEKLEYTVNVEDAGKYYNHLLDKLLNIKMSIKGDSNVKNTMQISFLQL